MAAASFGQVTTCLNCPQTVLTVQPAFLPKAKAPGRQETWDFSAHSKQFHLTCVIK